ncbi:3-methyl-2-oxobutanoate hydroxymethyltransferase [Pragia fontium]|uniref:3-methyl-2-oxobutanoate hydroxymethyltransferase n=1 Tax=Pragia fontium TaxID=82985 RepID=A0ABQ5LD72_9GAMM|nr:3-methyl-2-oxobutanoate hydroxymethyltransferase [Pragia fontium]GKX61565.1 3-methyl-2-oxobutanoate hydroxymethyltransferase [Pragia fontium]
MRNTVVTMQQQKNSLNKITMLTAYDYSTARLMDESGIEAILVGDSLGMVMLGYPDTLSVTMEDMIHHSKAVARGVQRAMIITDLPFMSYQVSVQEALSNAGHLIKEGRAHAVKLEGGEEVCAQIKAITQAAIPVMGHLGLTPQSVNAFGGFKVQGRDEAAARKIIQSALAVEKAGAFAVVLECVPATLASLISQLLVIPTIGIGAGAGCDGQVLVYQDMLGMYDGVAPKFAKQFVNIGERMKGGFQQYIQETKEQAFPAIEHTFHIDDAVIEKLQREYA